MEKYKLTVASIIILILASVGGALLTLKAVTGGIAVFFIMMALTAVRFVYKTEKFMNQEVDRLDGIIQAYEEPD